MARVVLNYRIQPSEYWALTRSQRQALHVAADEIAQRMKG